MVRRFTPQQSTFIKHVVGTSDPVYAATKAGYSMPEVKGYQQLQKPHVAAAVESERRTLVAKVERMALDRLTEMLTQGREMRDSDRTAAIESARKWANDLRTSDADKPKELHEMTAEEIAAQLEQLRKAQREKAEGAKDVTPDQIEGDDLEPGAFG